ncbi:MAG: hypothetical protein ABI778_05405, partial [Ignavibacteriota bacterium]
MKHLLRIFLFASFLFSCVPLRAQWERIGWQGGKIDISAQLGKTLYGTSLQGIHKSTDFGKTWKSFQSGLPVSELPTYHLYSYPTTDGEYLYLTNEPKPIWPFISENGLYFCKEKDTAWTFIKIAPIPTPLPFKYSTSCYFYSEDTLISYFRQNSTPDSLDGLYVSTNRGSSWNKRDHILPNRTTYYFRNGTRIFRTSWLQDYLNDTAYCEYSKTDNLGTTWEYLQVPWSDSLFVSYYAPDDQVLFAQTRNIMPESRVEFLYRSTDNGITWKIPNGKLPSTEHAWEIDFIKKFGSALFMFVEEYTDIGRIYTLYSSTDLGASWNTIALPDTVMKKGRLFGKADNLLFSYAKVQPTIYFRTDSSFRSLKEVSFDQALCNNGFINYVSGTTLYSCKSNYYSDSFYVSIDNGLTWESHLFFEHNYLNPSKWVKDGNYLYAAGSDPNTYLQQLYRSTDDGNSWTLFSRFPRHIEINQILPNGDTLLAGFGTFGTDTILVTIDGGRSWVDIQTPLAQFGIRDYDISYTEKLLRVSSSTQYAYISSDLGTTWAQEGFPGSPFGATGSASLLRNNWYTATERKSDLNEDFYGLFRVNNDGSSWRRCIGLDSNLTTLPQKLSEGSKGVVFVPSFSKMSESNPNNSGRNALFYSEDEGSTWHQVGEYFIDGTEFWEGSEYLFMAGSTSLWRFPKSALPLRVSKAKSITSISINECYPNPASSKMRISYSIPKRSHVSLSVFDITGKE